MFCPKARMEILDSDTTEMGNLRRVTVGKKELGSTF